MEPLVNKNDGPDQAGRNKVKFLNVEVWPRIPRDVGFSVKSSFDPKNYPKNRGAG